MSLEYILRRVQSTYGVGSSDLNNEQRTWLLDIINEAAAEVYYSKDIPGSVKELYVQLEEDTLTVTLPSFVGKLRAVRDVRDYPNPDNKWQLNDLRPRYVQNDWAMKWNKFRIVGKSPICRDITIANPLTLFTDSPLESTVVHITGETTDSNRKVDSIIMDAEEVTGEVIFTDIRSIRKEAVSQNNITVKDSEGTELALIYADQLSPLYTVVDISQYPDLSYLCESGNTVFEVLYKERPPRLIYDEDTFILGDEYDKLIILKTKQLLAEDEEGKEQRALLMDRKAERELNRLIEDEVGPNKKMINQRTSNIQKVSRLFRRGYFG